MTTYRPLHEQGMGRMISELFGSAESEYLPLVGRKLKSVKVINDRGTLVFEFADGAISYLATGDCCSHTWIEHLEVPAGIEGAEISGVTDHPVIDATEDNDKNPITSPESDWYQREHECLQLYQTVFHTNKGDISTEYRNSSNGYYGGRLELIAYTCKLCGEEVDRFSIGSHAKCFKEALAALDAAGRGGS